MGGNFDAALDAGIDLCGFQTDRAGSLAGGFAEMGLHGRGAFDQRIGGLTGFLLDRGRKALGGVFQQIAGFSDLHFKGLREAFGCRSQVPRHTRTTHGDQFFELVGAGSNIIGQTLAAFNQAGAGDRTDGFDARGDIVALGSDGVGDILAGLTQGICQRHGARGQHFGDRATRCQDRGR